MNPTTELAIRLAAFAGVFSVMALWELLAPRRPLAVGRSPRWPSNLGILVADVLAVRLLLPTAAAGVALVAAARGFGLFHVVGLPFWLAAPIGFWRSTSSSTASTSCSITCRGCGVSTACTMR